jgi:hypothetical protein
LLNDSEPEVALSPLQPPPAAQEVAFVLDHVSVLEPPELTLVGLALRETVGAGSLAGVPPGLSPLAGGGFPDGSLFEDEPANSAVHPVISRAQSNPARSGSEYSCFMSELPGTDEPLSTASIIGGTREGVAGKPMVASAITTSGGI